MGPRILICATVATYIKWGTTAQTATSSSYDLFLPAGAVVAYDIGAQTHAAVIRHAESSSADGFISFQKILETT